MNGFLVVLVQNHDDLPLSLHATFDDAYRAALVAEWESPSHHPFGTNSDPCTIVVVEFRNSKPIKSTLIRAFADEQANV